jgi:integrase
MLKHAYDADLIDRPIKLGQQFNRPSAKEKRQSRNRKDREHGKRLFTPEQVLALCKAADEQMKAMILLGVNGGFGNNDCATLPSSAVDLDQGLIDYERPKTAVQRLVPLWPVTVAALRAVIEGKRPQARRPEYDKLVFLTLFGNPWSKHSVGSTSEGDPKVRRQQGISPEFYKLAKKTGLAQFGRGFYALRHTFRTWADETKDQHAVHRIMGHAIPGMSGVYVEEISLERLRAVTDHVRAKLFSDAPASHPQ